MRLLQSDWDIQIPATLPIQTVEGLVCDTSLRSVMGVFLSLSTKTKGYFSAINTKPKDDRAKAKTSAYLCWYHIDIITIQ